MDKTEIVIDLNPLSRSAQVAAVPIVDNVLRAVPNITAHAEALAEADDATLADVVAEFDPDGALQAAERRLRSGELA
jgi:4-phosphopantoate--beta-alanine ligase